MIAIQSSDILPSDPLSDVLALMNVRGFLSRRIEASGSWSLCFPKQEHMKFGGIIEGSRWIWIAGVTEPLKLDAGDFYLLTHGGPYLFASDIEAKPVDGIAFMAEHLQPDGVVRFDAGEGRTVGAGGRFAFDDDTSTLLLECLPPLIHIRSGEPQARALRSALELITFETEVVRAGCAVLSSSLCKVVLVNILRAYLSRKEQPVGWLGALSDRRIGSSLQLMHRNVAHRWTVGDLASEVGMSRASFAERFRRLVGAPPLEYLTHWRLAVARSELRLNRTNLAQIAEKVGYDSETSFSAAFRRRFGKSPGRYRDSREK